MTDIVERLRVMYDTITTLRAEVERLRDGNEDMRHTIEQWEPNMTTLRAEVERLRAALIDTAASLAAAISLLERGGKKAAASDKMFAQMLVDYNRSLDIARAALTQEKQ